MGAGADHELNVAGAGEQWEQFGGDVRQGHVPRAVGEKNAEAFAVDCQLELADVPWVEGLADERLVVGAFGALPRADDVGDIFLGDSEGDDFFAVMEFYLHFDYLSALFRPFRA